jgi:Cytosine deaminase and related metal-dependent hydrolases
MSTLLVKNIRYLVSCDEHDTVYERVNLFVRDQEIASIGPEIYPADQTIDATNMVVYPGLVNTHHHLYQCFTRNLPEVQRMELFPWLVTNYEIWKNLNEEIIYYSGLTAMGELAKTGTTTVFDHHYLFPNGCGDIIGQQLRTASELGVRMVSSRGSMDLSKKDGGLPPDSVVQTEDEILKDTERLVHVFHDDSRFSMRQIVVSPCSPFTNRPETYQSSAKLARHLGVRIHTHLAETLDEEEFTLNKFGMRPLAYMETLDMVGSDVWYAHGIHFNDEELKLLADTQTGVCHCPVSNMKLASGICRVPEMLELGVPLGLGVDGSASNDGSNMLEELRVSYLLHRLKYSAKAPTGYDLLKVATVGGAKLLGRDDIGHLAPGMAADFFLLNLDQIPLIATQFDPKNLLGTVGFKGSVDYTIINGRVVVERGELVTVDEKNVVRQANTLVRQYLNR